MAKFAKKITTGQDASAGISVVSDGWVIVWAYWHYGAPYNITTGTDANGDGSFNDRPSYTSAIENGTYATPFGLMTTNAVNGDVSRNIGTMPTVLHIYSNLGRDFKFSSSKENTRTLTLNARAANLLNHTM
jgi:hypothetical protein